MNTVIDKLFITPMTWLLAVPIVLLDRVLAPELRRPAAALRPHPQSR